MSPARARTRTARSGVERTNHEATAPPFHDLVQTNKPQGSSNYGKYYLFNSVSDGGEDWDEECKIVHFCGMTEIDLISMMLGLKQLCFSPDFNALKRYQCSVVFKLFHVLLQFYNILSGVYRDFALTNILSWVKNQRVKFTIT